MTHENSMIQQLKIYFAFTANATYAITLMSFKEILTTTQTVIAIIGLAVSIFFTIKKALDDGKERKKRMELMDMKMRQIAKDEDELKTHNED